MAEDDDIHCLEVGEMAAEVALEIGLPPRDNHSEGFSGHLHI